MPIDIKSGLNKIRKAIPLFVLVISIWIVFCIAELIGFEDGHWWTVPYIITSVVFVAGMFIFTGIKYWIPKDIDLRI
jgi:ABC-type xylose transport system permease subunit